MVSEDVKVLYIAGTMRSGSTLLARLLGELPQVVDVGELRLLFSPMFHDGSLCGCRETIPNCEFWRAVFERAFGGLSNLDRESLCGTWQAYRPRALPRLLLARASPLGRRRLREYAAALGALYRAVRDLSGARVLVDASKDPFYAYLLERTPGVDLRAVHLVRDSRAVAFSQKRVKSDPPEFPNPSRLPVVSPGRTALLWNAVNLLLTLKKVDGDSLLLRYEDLVADPEAALERLGALMGEAALTLDFLRASPLSLSASHTVGGNPDRFKSQVTIRPDDEWRREMSPHDRRLVTTLTYPLLRRYGYLSSPPAPEERARVRPAGVL